MVLEDAWMQVLTSLVTIHWVDSMLIPGVIKQVRVPRLEGDKFWYFSKPRIHETEYKLYPEVLDSQKALELKDNSTSR